MILWALVIAASITASEAILRLPLLAEVRSASRYASKSMAVLRSSHISDHWKEQILPAYAFRIGKGAVVFFHYLCLALAPVAALGLLYPPGFTAWSSPSCASPRSSTCGSGHAARPPCRARGCKARGPEARGLRRPPLSRKFCPGLP